MVDTQDKIDNPVTSSVMFYRYLLQLGLRSWIKIIAEYRDTGHVSSGISPSGRGLVVEFSEQITLLQLYVNML